MSIAALLVLLLLSAPAYAASPPHCTFGPGDLPAVTQPTKPHGSDIPIDTIVVFMQENRSFDHYFGQLHFQGQRKARPEPRKASNPDPTSPDGPPIRAFHKTRYCETSDLDHSWSATHREWNDGKMDGFTTENAGDPADLNGSRTMGFFDQGDLPFYYGLYSTFAIGDRFFCSVLGPTYPNRFYLLAGTSFGHIRNDFPTDPNNEFSPAGGTIFHRLDEAGVTWKVYYSQLPFAALFAYVRRERAANVVPIAQYFADAQAGTLPQVSFVDPIFLSNELTENDEHPPANVQIGQEFASRVVNAVISSPQWPHAALFLVYDEHGGFFDHVPPPAACTPDDVEPLLQPNDVPGHFDNLGIRVPVAVISPYARPHHVTHKAYDHTSIVRFIATRFDLPALTRRDANANPMLGFFNFKKPRLLTPPPLPTATIDPTHFAECGGSPGGAFF